MNVLLGKLYQRNWFGTVKSMQGVPIKTYPLYMVYVLQAKWIEYDEIV